MGVIARQEGRQQQDLVNQPLMSSSLRIQSLPLMSSNLTPSSVSRNYTIRRYRKIKEKKRVQACDEFVCEIVHCNASQEMTKFELCKSDVKQMVIANNTILHKLQASFLFYFFRKVEGAE